MKQFLLSICCLLSIGSLYSQARVIDFSSAITSAPLKNKIFLTDVIYNDGVFCGMEERSIKPRKSSKNARDDYAKMGHIIDSLALLDYKMDTIYVLSTYYIPGETETEIFKIREKPFYLLKDSSGKYMIQYVDIQNELGSLDPMTKASDSLFFSTIYSWNIEQLIQMIKASGGYTGSEYFMSATRIIIHDNKVVNKEIINFKPTLRWHL